MLCLRHLQPLASRIFIAFPVFALKIVYTSSFVSLIWPPIATNLFLDGCLIFGAPNGFSPYLSWKFLEITWIHNFYKQKYSKNIKIKTALPHHFLKTVPEKHIINIFSLTGTFRCVGSIRLRYSIDHTFVLAFSW